MGQILRPDYIPALVKTSATQLKLPSGAWITIGGRQYRTSADTFLNVTLSANTLYYVYAVVSGGTISLVQSTNANSVGPAGYSQWILVGAFITGRTGAFATFANLDSPILPLVYGSWTNSGGNTPTNGNPLKFVTTDSDIYQCGENPTTFWRFYPPRDGLYRFTATGFDGGSSSGGMIFQVYKNGISFRQMGQMAFQHPNGGFYDSLMAVDAIPLLKTDNIYINWVSGAGAALTACNLVLDELPAQITPLRYQ